MADLSLVSECGICFEDTIPEYLRVLSCGHGYCQLCINKLDQRKHGKPRWRECPECRDWSEPSRALRVAFVVQQPQHQNNTERAEHRNPQLQRLHQENSMLLKENASLRAEARNAQNRVILLNTRLMDAETRASNVEKLVEHARQQGGAAGDKLAAELRTAQGTLRQEREEHGYLKKQHYMEAKLLDDQNTRLQAQLNQVNRRATLHSRVHITSAALIAALILANLAFVIKG